MKKINRIFVSLLCALPVFAGCAKEVIEVGAPEDPNCQGVYFETLTADQKSIELDPADETTLTFKAFRTKESGNITVPVKVTTLSNGEVEIFTATDIKFEDGQTETSFEVKFPNAEIGTTYGCQIACDDPGYVSTYSAKPTGISFEITRVKWNLVKGPNGEEYGSWTDDILSSMFGFSSLYVVNDKIKIYERDDKKGFYRINEVYNPYMVAKFWGGQYPDEDFEENCTPGTINYIDATDPTKVWLPVQTTGATVGSDGYIEFASFVPENGFKNDSDYGTLVNGVIKFPVNGIGVNFTVTGGWYSGNASGKTVIVFPGCKDTDYSVKLKAELSYEGKVPVYITRGEDVDVVKYAAYEGVVAEADVHTKALEISRDTEALVAESDELSIAFEKTGKYTIVAIALDSKGNLQTETSIVVTCVAADDEVPVVVSCGIGSAAKYKPMGVSTDNAIEYYVYGEDLVDVKMYAVKKLDLISDQKAAITALLKSKSISDEQLALVNGNGLYGYIGKLLPGTEYYLLVYANNGFEEKVIMSETSVLTTGDPLPIYQNFTYDNEDVDHIPANAAALAGKYNFYAVDHYGSLGMREYISKVTITDTQEAEGPDAKGLYDEYVSVSGIFDQAKKLYGFKDDSMTFDYYDGVIYQLASETFGPGSGNYAAFDFTPMAMTRTNKLYTTIQYALLGICVGDGYFAFLSDAEYADMGYEFCGFNLGVFNGANYIANAAGYDDLLLVAEGKDDNGLAPKVATARASAALRPILDELKNMPDTYFPAKKDRIRRAIDKAKSKLLWGEVVSVEATRDYTEANITVSAGVRQEKTVAARELKANLRNAVVR